MVLTLREKHEQEERRRRVDRIAAVRQQAAQLGVASAHMYRSAKHGQDDLVRAAIRSRVSAERQQRRVEVAADIVMADARRGEGMRAAARKVAADGRVAQEELAAWGAEHRLAALRHGLALDVLHADSAAADASQRQVEERRAKARDIESQRTAAVVARSKHQQQQQRQTDQQARNSPSFSALKRSVAGADAVSVVLAATELSRADAERAADAAPAHHSAREEARRREATRVRETRQAAQQRAAELELQRRHDELMRQQEAARAAALQKELIAAAQRRSGRPGFAEFQEEEARRSQRINHQAHLEFERLFLAQDGWEIHDLQRFGAAEATNDADATSALFDPASVEGAIGKMMTCMYALPVRQIHAAELTTHDEAATEAA